MSWAPFCTRLKLCSESWEQLGRCILQDNYGGFWHLFDLTYDFLPDLMA